MEIKIESSTRGIKVLVDGKHKKTFPRKYYNAFLDISLSEINLDKKRLNPADRKLLEITLLWQKYLKYASVHDRSLYSFIKFAKPVSTRIVATPTKDRMELILDNKMRIVTPNEKIFKLFPTPPVVFQNY